MAFTPFATSAGLSLMDKFSVPRILKCFVVNKKHTRVLYFKLRKTYQNFLKLPQTSQNFKNFLKLPQTTQTYSNFPKPHQIPQNSSNFRQLPQTSSNFLKLPKTSQRLPKNYHKVSDNLPIIKMTTFGLVLSSSPC